MISDIVQDFTKLYGLSGITMTEGGSLRLTIADIGDLQLVHTRSKLITGLTRVMENSYLLNGQKILSVCHFREHHLRPLHAQLNENTIGIFYIFDENEVTAALLSEALGSLADIMDQIFQSL